MSERSRGVHSSALLQVMIDHRQAGEKARPPPRPLGRGQMACAITIVTSIVYLGFKATDNGARALSAALNRPAVRALLTYLHGGVLPWVQFSFGANCRTKDWKSLAKSEKCLPPSS